MDINLISCFGRALPATCAGEKPADRATVNKQGVLCGYAVHPDCCTESVGAWLGLQRIDYGATFYTTWSEVLKKNRFELYLDQLVHYASTYGTDFAAGNGFVPNAGARVPDFKALKVITPITPEELEEKCRALLATGAALKTDTMKSVCNFLIERQRSGGGAVDLRAVKNKEASAYLALQLGVWPDDEFGILRTLVYAHTGSCLLIKGADTVRAIRSACGGTVQGWAVRPFGPDRKSSFRSPLLALSEVQLVKLSRIFYRFKPIFLAMKTKKTAAVVNRLRKLAVRNHVPFKAGFWESVLTTPHAEAELQAALPGLDNFRKVRLLQAVNVARLDEEAKVYLVRNGKVYVRRWYRPRYDAAYLDVLRRVLRRSLVASLAAKACKVRYPADFELAAPSSEKSYIGNFPFGTRLRLSEHNVLGIYWRNEWGTRDFDLSFTDREGRLVSWRGSYWSGPDAAARDVVYSGDMTNADPEATELLYIAGSCPDGLVRVNQFNGESRSRFRFFAANERIANPKEMLNHMVDPNGVKLETMVDVDASASEKIVGLVHDNTLVLMDLAFGKGRCADGSHSARDVIAAASRRTGTFLDLKELLAEAGFTEDAENPDLDLANPAKDTLLDLFAGGG